MARPIWKGIISFGLVTVPVNLHPALRPPRFGFRLLHQTDLSPVRLERICVREDRAVAWNELVRGYEYEKGKVAVLTEKDFEAAALENDRTIDIMNFVKAEEIDPRFFARPYYLTPGEDGERGYALLRDAIRETGRVAIARFLFRERQRLVALSAIGTMLALTVIRFADEIMDLGEFDLPDSHQVGPQELDVAKRLVLSLTAAWKPEQYPDIYRANVMRLIRAKLKGTTPKLESEAQPQHAEVIQLMARLRESLEADRRPRHERRRATSAKRSRSGKTPRRVA